MNYFETVYKKQNQIIEIDAPILLQETAIIKDTVDNLIQLRNIFFNVGSQKIIALAIRISQSDVFGEKISEPFEFVYEDICFNPHESFGNKIAVDLHSKARKVKIDILKAVLEDGTVWVSNPEKIVEIQPQREIEGSDDFIESIDSNNIKPIFYYAENDSCWQCTCGEPNTLNSTTCRKCHRNKEDVKKLFNSESIHNLFKSYREKLEQERIKNSEKEKGTIIEESRAPETKENLEKNTRSGRNKFIVIVVAVVALIVILSMIVSNSRNNKKAQNDIYSVFKDNSFQPANEIYERIGKILLKNLGEDYISQISDDGDLGIIQKDKSEYTFLVECDDKDWNPIPTNESTPPDRVLFFDCTSSLPDLNNIAYFIDCLDDELDYSGVLNLLKNKVEYLPNKQLGLGSNISINGKMYHLIKMDDQDNIYILGAFSQDFDYLNQDAKTALMFVFFNDKASIDKIETLSDSQVTTLLSYYKNHENEYFENIDDLIDRANLNIASEDVSELIQKTEDSIDPYLNIIGKEMADDESLKVSDEFIDGMDKVFIMGKLGTVEHASTTDSGNTITTMDWISNDPCEKTEFEEYIKLLNQFFDDTAIIAHYEHVTHEDVWAWNFTKDDLWPICFLENNRIDIRFYDKSAVVIPDTQSGADKSEKKAESSNNKSSSNDKQQGSSLSNNAANNNNTNSSLTESVNNNETARENTISYDATLRYGTGSVVVFSSKDAMDRFMSAMANENQGTIDEMLASGEVGYISAGTKCNILEEHLTWGRVKILEGAYLGSSVYVVSEAIQKK